MGVPGPTLVQRSFSLTVSMTPPFACGLLAMPHSASILLANRGNFQSRQMTIPESVTSRSPGEIEMARVRLQHRAHYDSVSLCAAMLGAYDHVAPTTNSCSTRTPHLARGDKLARV